MSHSESSKPVESSSRRLFLKGGRLPSHPWDAFCVRLQRACKGSVQRLEPFGGRGRARLSAFVPADVHHALSLCRQYGVQLALDMPGTKAHTHAGPVLWVQVGQQFDQSRPMGDAAGRWFVQPGCTIGVLVNQGFMQFAGLPGHTTVADWLLGQGPGGWPSGATDGSGVVYASVLLADGTQAGLGPFGERNTKPLDGVRLRQLVSSLFQLLAGPAGQACRSQPHWPARYRLDALAPAGSSVINLAHLVLQSLGELAWVDWLVIEPRQALQSLALASEPCTDTGLLAQACQLDRAVKQLFDPHGVFPAGVAG